MQYFIVDAFSAEPFKGNPAAVVLLDQSISEQSMQSIAKEFNLAETAFLLKKTDQRWSLRWFTPTTEIDLCGHATLASAHCLWRELGFTEETFIFETLSGELLATRRADKSVEKIELNFPSIAVDATTVTQATLNLLKLSPVATFASHHDLLLVLENEESIRNYQVDVANVEKLDFRGLIITAKANSESGVDFVSRFFAPKLGIPEDPVTGAIHCALTPYWANEFGKSELSAKQLSQRGGKLNLRLENEKVFLAGDSITVMEGTLRMQL